MPLGEEMRPPCAFRVLGFDEPEPTLGRFGVGLWMPCQKFIMSKPKLTKRGLFFLRPALGPQPIQGGIGRAASFSAGNSFSTRASTLSVCQEKAAVVHESGSHCRCRIELGPQRRDLAGMVPRRTTSKTCVLTSCTKATAAWSVPQA